MGESRFRRRFCRCKKTRLLLKVRRGRAFSIHLGAVKQRRERESLIFFFFGVTQIKIKKKRGAGFLRRDTIIFINGGF